MKVLHVYRTYFPDPPGGLQEAIRQICISTQAYGVENTVFTLSPKPWPQVIDRPEARVVRCRSWGAPASCDLGSLDAVQTFRHLASQTDVIHYLFPWPYADLLRLFAPKKPSVLTYISDIVRQRWLGMVYGPLMSKMLRSMDAIVSNAPAYAETSPILVDMAYRDQVRLIPLGINESPYPKNRNDSLLQRIGLGGVEPYFLFIGVLRYYKGLNYLIDAAAKVKAKVVIAGAGPEDNVLRMQLKQLGIQNVIFLGQVSDDEKVTLLQHCRALVLPSHLRSEAFGMVLVEASMFARPMITCEIGTGTSFVNQHEETGLIVPPADSEALAGAMNTLLNNEQLANEFGKNARSRYEKNFSGAILGKKYYELYEELIQKKKIN